MGVVAAASVRVCRGQLNDGSCWSHCTSTRSEGPCSLQGRLPPAVGVRWLDTGRLEHRYWPSDDHHERTPRWGLITALSDPCQLISEQSRLTRH